MISAAKIRALRVASLVISAQMCGSVEYPSRTLPLCTLVCLRACVTASPPAASGVSTMMRFTSWFSPVMCVDIIRDMGACIPGPISITSQSPVTVDAM